MSIKQSLRFLVVLALIICIAHVQSKESVREKRKSGGGGSGGGGGKLNAGLNYLALGISIASYIQGTVCTFSDICGGDELTNRLDKLDEKITAIQNDVTTVRNDVEDIWDESKRKWYFKHIDNILQQRAAVILDIKNNDNTQRAKDKRNRFVLEVFGTHAKDEYVEKALFHIPKLIVEERLVMHYYEVQKRNGKSDVEAAKLTWKFTKKLFRYQEDGYVSVVLAASIKYKNDDVSFDKTMAEVCKRWPREDDPEFVRVCAKHVADIPYAINRRKWQQDFLFNITKLARHPAMLTGQDANNFKDAYAVHYAADHVYVAHPNSKKISIVNVATFKIVRTFVVPGTHCGGNCHPYAASVKPQHNIMAVTAHNQATGGKSFILLFKLDGDLTKPADMSITFYEKMELMPVGHRNADARDVVFCGDRIGYGDYNGVARTWRMPDKGDYLWNNGKPKIDRWDRHDWELRRVVNDLLDHQYFFTCSTDGKYWVVERTNGGHGSPFAGTLPTTGVSGGDVKSHLNLIIEPKDMKNGEGHSRKNELKGIAMDKKGNFFISFQKVWSNGITSMQKRLSGGKGWHYIWEWPGNSRHIEMFGMAVDDKGHSFAIQNHGSGRVFFKFHHEIDLEDITNV